MDKFVIFRSVGTNVGNKILDLLEQMLGYIYIWIYDEHMMHVMFLYTLKLYYKTNMNI